MLYVSSSDPRIGAGPNLGDTNLDTNSGVISRLTRTPQGWEKVDLVRGLPRSEENHATNGMHLDEATGTLYVTSAATRTPERRRTTSPTRRSTRCPPPS